MISDKTRKNITNAALIYVLVIMLGMFIPFFNVGNAINYIQIVIEFLKVGSLIWLSFGFLELYKDDRNKIILYSAIIVFVASQINLIAQTLYILYSVGAIPITRLNLLPTNLVEIIAIIGLTIGFYQLKTAVDKFATERRNVYRGQMSLPMGFGFLALRKIIEVIIPQDTYVSYATDGSPVVAQGYDILLWINYFLEMGSLVLMVLGFWYLRRAFLVLDKIPDQVFQQMEERKQEAAQRPATGGLFGRRGGLFGGFTPPPPPPQTGQKKPDPLDNLLVEEESSKKKMFCVKCGLELDEDSAFCANCGEENPYLKK